MALNARRSGSAHEGDYDLVGSRLGRSYCRCMAKCVRDRRDSRRAITRMSDRHIVERVSFLLSLLLVACHATAGSTAEPRRFEIMGSSEDWIAVRENVADRGHEPAKRCGYPGLADSIVGQSIHFLELTEPMKRGRIVELDAFAASYEIFAAPGADGGCTDSATSKSRRTAAHRFAAEHEVELAPKASPLAILGEPIRSDSCEALERTQSPGDCGRLFELTVDGKPLRIARSLLAVPEAPDYVTCQFMGHRFLAALQVSWLGLAKYGALSAPGGFVSHYDCRPQLFLPLQVYESDELISILLAFRGENVADWSEHVSILVFPKTE